MRIVPNRPKRPVIKAANTKAADPIDALRKLMGCPDLASKRWIWDQYDHLVGNDTIQTPGGDAAVVRVHDTRKALAMVVDCTPRYCVADPKTGGAQAVVETWRNLTAVGAEPIAVAATDATIVDPDQADQTGIPLVEGEVVVRDARTAAWLALVQALFAGAEFRLVP